jgi:hypothetical protein
MGSPTINRTSFLCEFLVMRLFKYVHEEDMRYIWGGGGCNRNEMLYHGISNSYLQLYSIEFTWLINWVWCNINGSVWFMVFNATFNNISVLSWRSHTLYHVMLYRVHLTMSGVRTPNFSGDKHRLHRYL